MPPVLSVTLTNLVQMIALPFIPCLDLAVMSGYFVGDGTNIYGIRMEALDARTNVTQSAWVGELYIPPVPEMAVLRLSPDARFVRCSLEGPGALARWSGGRFTLSVDRPALRIRRDGNGIALDWFDPYGCWEVQPIPVLGTEAFRLERTLITP